MNTKNKTKTFTPEALLILLIAIFTIVFIILPFMINIYNGEGAKITVNQEKVLAEIYKQNEDKFITFKDTSDSLTGIWYHTNLTPFVTVTDCLIFYGDTCIKYVIRDGKLNKDKKEYKYTYDGEFLTLSEENRSDVSFTVDKINFSDDNTLYKYTVNDGYISKYKKIYHKFTGNTIEQ